jgi:hypothetical protein
MNTSLRIILISLPVVSLCIAISNLKGNIMSDRNDKPATTLTEKEFKALSDLFHAFPEAFYSVSLSIRDKYYSRLYQSHTAKKGN